MTRPFDFTATERFQARFRQSGRCACCNVDLNSVAEHAHHVVPNQSGSPDSPQHAWLRTQINCVVLCEMCHVRVHQDGRFATGAVAPPDYYPHSHGRNAAQHRAWALDLNVRSRLLYSNTEPK